MGSLVTDGTRRVLASLCDKIKEHILDGACDHVSANDVETWLRFNDLEEYMSAYRASKHMGVSLSKFYEYRMANLVPEPIRIKGMQKAMYPKAVIDNAIKEISAMPEHELKIKILAAKAAQSKKKREALLSKLPTN